MWYHFNEKWIWDIMIFSIEKFINIEKNLWFHFIFEMRKLWIKNVIFDIKIWNEINFEIFEILN